MPSEQIIVGSQRLPIDPNGVNSSLVDPTVDGLLSYFGFWIKATLDSKLAEMGGPTASDPVTDACPVTHRFPWNHQGSFAQRHDVGAGEMAVPLPGLWCWSDSSEYDRESSTILNDAYRRDVTLQWIFPEVQVPSGFRARAGLLSHVERALRAAVSEGRHVGYQSGQNICGLLGLTAIRLGKLETGAMLPVPRKAKTIASTESTIVRFYPAVTAKLSVVERVGQWLPDVISDTLGDINVTISEQQLDVLERVLIDPEDLT